MFERWRALRELARQETTMKATDRKKGMGRAFDKLRLTDSLIKGMGELVPQLRTIARMVAEQVNGKYVPHAGKCDQEIAEINDQLRGPYKRLHRLSERMERIRKAELK